MIPTSTNFMPCASVNTRKPPVVIGLTRNWVGHFLSGLCSGNGLPTKIIELFAFDPRGLRQIVFARVVIRSIKALLNQPVCDFSHKLAKFMQGINK